VTSRQPGAAQPAVAQPAAVQPGAAQPAVVQSAAYEQEPLRPPAGAVEVLLVRHGQSQAYVDGTSFALTGGHGDPPLSARGRAQAGRVCARLDAEGVTAIYVTTLRRTAQTAEPLAGRLGIAVRVEPDLREVYLGEWEGGEYRKMVAESHPIALRMFEQERWDVIPGAESTADFAGRVRAAIGRLVAGHPGERVVAFTHGGVIGQALALATGSRPFAFIGADNASISRLLIIDGRWIIRGFNDVAHLTEPAGARA
jgi:probable phosphoglycerate mutase